MENYNHYPDIADGYTIPFPLHFVLPVKCEITYGLKCHWWLGHYVQACENEDLSSFLISSSNLSNTCNMSFLT